MLIIGLTGGIGSGKSTVLTHFKQLSIPTLDTDDIARECVTPNTKTLKQITDHFKDQDLLQKNGTLNRQKLRQIIFNNPQERQWLENLLHPLILENTIAKLNKIKLGTIKTPPYCIVCIPLLIETHPLFTKIVDRILVVDVPESIQIERAKTRDNLTQKQAQAMLSTQVSRKARLKAADDIIDNTKTPEHLPSQIEALHQKYCQLPSVSG